MWKLWFSSANWQEAENAVLELSGTGFERRKTMVDIGQDRHINTLECYTDNSKVNLVIAGGYGAAIGMFFRNFNPLSKYFRVYAFDWLGTGCSSRPEWTCKTPEEAEAFFVDSLEDWRRQLGLEKFVLMGHSLGGYLSACYALKKPEHVQHLLLVSPVGIPRSPQNIDVSKAPFIFKMARHLWSMDVTPQSVVRALGPFGPGLIGQFASRRFGSEILNAQEIERLQRYMYEYFRMPACGEYALNTILMPGAYARNPLCDRLPQLTVPVSFFYGDRDWMDKKAAIALMPQMKVPAAVHVVHSAGHHLYMDNPNEFHTLVLEECREMLAPQH